MSLGLAIFDFDGVVVESEPINIASIAKTLQSYQLPVDIEWVQKHIYGRSFQVTRNEVLEQFDFVLPEDFAERQTARAKRAYISKLRAVDKIPQALRVLDGFDRCIASGAPNSRIDFGLHLTRLGKYFPKDRRFSSQHLAHGKPAPDVFLYAAERLGYQPEDCTVIEDSVPGVVAGRRPGMKVIGRANPLASHAELVDAGAHLTIGGMELLPGAMGIIDFETQMPGFNEYRDAYARTGCFGSLA